jgi:peptidoglycan L-alanyl-D-glutamate endopeptidase CwlK
MQTAADELGVAIVWGGRWRSFPDGPHHELDRKVYP